MSHLASFKSFPIAAAAVTLWIFKKRINSDTGLPVFTAKWASVDEKLASEIKEALSGSLNEITELIDYSLLAQNNEGSALSLSVEETHADQVLQKASAETPSSKVTDEKSLQNTVFYAVKLTDKDQVLFAVKKTDSSWRTKKRRDVISFLMKDFTLMAASSESFNISKKFDMIIFGDQIAIKQKANFESILSYKTAHKDEFVALRTEEQFKKVFVSLDELVAYVGDNKILLRRAAAIKQKGYYKNETYMKNLRERYQEAKLNLKFDENGKMIITSETCRDIFQALLDFRLASMFSQNIYDVPDTSAVSSA